MLFGAMVNGKGKKGRENYSNLCNFVVDIIALSGLKVQKIIEIIAFTWERLTQNVKLEKFQKKKKIFSNYISLLSSHHIYSPNDFANRLRSSKSN